MCNCSEQYYKLLGVSPVSHNSFMRNIYTLTPAALPTTGHKYIPTSTYTQHCMIRQIQSIPNCCAYTYKRDRHNTQSYWMHVLAMNCTVQPQRKGAEMQCMCLYTHAMILLHKFSHWQKFKPSPAQTKLSCPTLPPLPFHFCTYSWQ